MKLARTFFLAIALALSARTAPPQPGDQASDIAKNVTFAAEPGRVKVSIGKQVIATYVYRDQKTLRPFFEHLKTVGGIQVTRSRPPVGGKDPVDHADMHPGLWLAFGDVSGHDFWRNKGPKVVHERFAAEPAASRDRGSFAVVNRYMVDDKVLCRETATYTIIARPNGYLILWDSIFKAEGDGHWFGSQEEMGLGVRVATPISVKSGNGRIENSAGAVNEKGTWGKAADWCDYAGTVDRRHVGATLMSDPLIGSDRKPWFHSRDYGVLVANPFGRRAGAPDKLPLSPDKPLRMRFAVFVHESPEDAPIDLAGEYSKLAELFR